MLTSTCTWFQIASPLFLASTMLLSPAQVSSPCSCHPDSEVQNYSCCDVIDSYINITTPEQHPRCWDFNNCNDLPATPCKWTVTMRITTLTQHDFSAEHNGVEVAGSDGSRSFRWAAHDVTANCDSWAFEMLLCDGAPCLEADMACWDCTH